MSQIWKFSRLGGITIMDKLDYNIDKIMDAIPQDWWYNKRDNLIDIDPEDSEEEEILVLSNWWAMHYNYNNKLYKEILKNYREDPSAENYYGQCNLDDKCTTQCKSVSSTQDTNTRV